MDVSQYLSMFLEESLENLSKLNDCLLELEQNPEDLDVVNAIFRVSHTIKGMSATMGYMKMSELTHKMEDVLSKFRDGTLKVNRDVVTILFRCLDTLESMVNNISDGNSDDMDIEEIMSSLSSVIECKINNFDDKTPLQPTIEEKLKLEEHHMNIINKEKNPYSVYEIKIVLAETVLLKTARVFIFFREIEKFGEIIHTLPSIQDIETENFDLEVDVVYITPLSEEKLKDIIKTISEINKVAIKEINSENVKKAYGEEVFINLEEAKENIKNQLKEDNGVENSEEQSKPKNNSKVNNENINKVQINADNKQVTKEKIVSPKKQSVTQKKGAQSVRVDLERLDMFMNMVSELVIHRTRLEQISKIGRAHV